MAAVALRTVAVGLAAAQGLAAPAPAAMPPASYASIAAAVGRICGSPIPRLPTVLVLSPRAYERILARRYGVEAGSLRRSGIAITAFYRPQQNVAVINATSGQAQQLARTAAEIPWFRRMEIFHELVHAWQFQRIPHLRAVLRREPTAGQALLEGQDVYATRCYARANGIMPLFRREQRFVRSLRVSPRGRESRVYFEFWKGYQFIRYLHSHAPRLTIQTVFTRPLPTEKQIWFSALYLTPTGGRTARLGWLRALGKESAGRPALTAIDFLGLRRYLVRCGYWNPVGSRILSSFSGGARIRCGKLELTALEFGRSAAATACAGVAELADKLTNGGGLSVGRFSEKGVRADFYIMRAGGPLGRRAVLIVRNRGVVWEADERGFAGDSAALRRWARRLLGRYVKIEQTDERGKAK